MILRRFVPVLLIALLATGCAATGAPSPAAPRESPRVRCLADPTETHTRPLFFLFCMQSP